MKHSCHKDQLSSIRRIEGQVRGVEKMIEEGKYCIDILNQIRQSKTLLLVLRAKFLILILGSVLKSL